MNDPRPVEKTVDDRLVEWFVCLLAESHVMPCLDVQDCAGLRVSNLAAHLAAMTPEARAQLVRNEIPTPQPSVPRGLPSLYREA